MTLAEALAEAQIELQDIFDAHREQLIADFGHDATAEELAAILRRHDQAHADAQRTAREIVLGSWHSGTGGIH